ncbi:complement component C8 alpha chain isoform X2 [Denticeps clupeoides]|uniref:complement component C8 alpha chain isoform X2 n=1 Tax=Denticeps clupeoides TaxID=299321 RepID=UPI0010A4BE58|nr:complement component C8 alpha chain isoform X2 [Denticeps clupeoides]
MNVQKVAWWLVLVGLSDYAAGWTVFWDGPESRPGRNATRKVRSPSTPAPVDCRLKAWSSWTPCNSCKNKSFRFRYLDQASQYGGTECLGSQWEEKLCPSAGVCVRESVCGDDFTCKETGHCISKHLRCNGEPDCGDATDEDECEDVDMRNDKCSYLFPIPGSERATQGYNIVTGDFVLRTLDPEYYGGTCEYVYNGEWRKLTYDAFCENLYYNDDEKYYRRPYNFHSYRLMAQAASDGSTEYYEDVTDFLNARKTDKSYNWGFTVGVSVEVGLSGSRESQFLTNISQYSSQNVGVARLVSTVQTAQFKMRSRNLVLDDDLLVSLLELPQEYDFGSYARFLSLYGTHYITQGSMGGLLEYVAIIDKQAMEKSEVRGEQVGKCFGVSLGLSDEVNIKVSVKTCDKVATLKQGGDSSKSFIKDVITLVKGGIADSSAGVKAIQDETTFRKWGRSLRHSPALIDVQILPIYELIRFSTAEPQVRTHLPHLRRAWHEYQQQFSSCRCGACWHNGVPILSRTSCSCICKQGSLGKACEETHRRGTTDGSWSCWVTWSPCQSGRKTRTRACNNPMPDNGAPCRGSAQQTQHC